ncbi:cytochrome bc complex cytochrome b subunit [Bartonella sp. 220]|uniref:cytochrome b n=1 Tax=Bartonella sp. 220B TaxID=2967260 RepID=UPI0022A9E1D8|nr:cytochrome bc complex cytochrome b subunit [Bartonella sp. 220B]MCZ2158381.1 cytochrome bc complex cytochrome b subunit [Bartonella sp. 220B]
MTKFSPYIPKSAVARWFDKRLPLPRFFYNAFVIFPVPRNLNYFYTFGGILTVMLLSQLLTGIVLALHYVPDVHLAFETGERFRREGQFGWLFRPWHCVGSSFFFIALYIHLARGLYYGSYKNMREMVWITGICIYMIMMATAFFGYVLVWGMMSVSAASVVVGLVKAIPLMGTWLHEALLGGYSVGQPTLNRFYVFHYFLSFVLLFLVGLHIWALHQVGQGNPTGLPIQFEKEIVPFAPYALIKDIFAIIVFLIFFAWFLFYMPDYMGQAENYSVADPLKAPLRVVPEWYFLPFYTMLRAITFNIGALSSTFLGVLLVVSSVFVLIFVPWLDRSKICSARYRPLYKIFFWAFIVDVLFLGWLGSREISDSTFLWTYLAIAYYFIFFLVVLPILPIFEKGRSLPSSITEDMNQRKSKLW